jgi:hypothetical protein
MLDVGEIDELAVAFDGYARKLEDMGRDLVRRAGAARWQGRRADEFRDQMGVASDRLHAVAEDARELAGLTRSIAAQARTITRLLPLP